MASAVKTEVIKIAVGDANADGYVDLADSAVLADCLNGPGAAPDPSRPAVTLQTCLDAFDFNGDGNIDVPDAGDFTTVFTGG